MESNKKNDNNDLNIADTSSLSFLKVDQLVRRSHALSILLRTDDIIVGLNGHLFKGGQKKLNQELKVEDFKVLTILRKKVFFNVKAHGPLGIKLLEIGNEEAEEFSKEAENYLKKNPSFDNFKEYEVYKGKNNFYDVLEINETSLLASILET